MEAKISRYFETAAFFLSCGWPYLLSDKSCCVKLIVSQLDFANPNEHSINFIGNIIFYGFTESSYSLGDNCSQ